MKLHMPEMPPATLLSALEFIQPSAGDCVSADPRRCDQAASEAALMRRGSSDERRETRRDLMRSFVEQYPEIRGHRHWDTIIRGGVASHHAGHIPAWKLVIEKLMSDGLLDAIFATATVAAGVDFPARTVVLDGSRCAHRQWLETVERLRTSTDDRSRRTTRSRQRRLRLSRSRPASGSGKNCRGVESPSRSVSQSVSRHLHHASEFARCLRQFRTGARDCRKEFCASRSCVPDRAT